MKKKLIIVAILVVIFSSLFYFRGHFRDLVLDWQRNQLPEEVTLVASSSPSDLPVIIPTKLSISTPVETKFKAINLAVPFSSQAPFGDWSEPYQNACEETSALMVAKYYSKEKITSEIAKQEILKIVAWENDTFGYYEDTTSAEIARLLKEYFGFKRVDVIYDISINDIKTELTAGRPVIIPFAGQLLGNPNFTSPGPIYHMLVVKGITKDGDFITNDDGTRNGYNYVYKADILYEAIHDAPTGGHTIDQEELNKSRRAMIVVYPN